MDCGPSAARTEASSGTCKVARFQYGKLAAAYRIRHGRLPKTLDEIKAAGMLPNMVPCQGGGSYTIDDRGMVHCSVHGH